MFPSVSAYVFIASIAAIEKCSIDDIWKEFGMDVYDDHIVAKECLTEADAKWERTDPIQLSAETIRMNSSNSGMERISLCRRNCNRISPNGNSASLK